MSDAMGDPALEAVLRSGVVLPSPSHSLLRLQAAARNENSGPRELAAVVRKDPVLVGVLIRVANSPVFYHQGEVNSVADAIARLGQTKTLAVAVNAALRNQMDGVEPRIVDAIWTRSATVAAWAMRAAHLCGQPRLADLAYLTGLVHDAGICVLLRRYPQHAGPFARMKPHELDVEAARLDAATGTAHAAVGSLVARNWKLPPAVAEAIRVHHSCATLRDVDEDAVALAIVTALGRRVVDGPNEEWDQWEPLAEARLGFTQPMLDGLTELAARASAEQRRPPHA